MPLIRFGRLAIGLMLLSIAAGSIAAQDKPAAKSKAQSVVGRWDITVHGADGDYPSWLEVRLSGYRTLVGSYVSRFGSARPIAQVILDKGKIRFTIPPQWEPRTDDQAFEAIVEGELLRGETTDEKGKRVTWEGRRAPSLKRDRLPTWGQSLELFNGHDLAGWKPRSASAKNGWRVQDGVMVNAIPGNDIQTERKFTDFKLHTEFRYPKGSNSGVYLRGRYEVQIEDDFGKEPDSHYIGGVYGFLTPSVNAGKKAGEWQTLDVTLVGRVVTVVLNGERIIDRQTIPGITGGALDSDEDKPGPILLQGDHGRVEFRKVTLTPVQADEKPAK
ncbi:MAG TPA: DUF1080 domain-containing protein [Gemmataceae bacterium]|jgi:hypothetical protein|nr:DUF1080 domain-containing protein [Gemmataceae bacterium]